MKLLIFHCIRSLNPTASCRQYARSPFKNMKGQTLIETALMLLFILAILLLITEFARAWFTKNSLKNAVRHGARVAVVTPVANFLPALTTQCPTPTPVTNPCGTAAAPGVITNAVMTSPGVPTNTTVTACFTNGPSPNTALDAGDTVKVCAATLFTYVVGGISPWPGSAPLWPKTTLIRADASMRYE